MVNACKLKYRPAILTLVLIAFFVGDFASADPVTTGATVYKSEADELLTIQAVSILPFSDNLQGIYARPLENHFSEAIGKMHRWDLMQVNAVGPVLSPEELEDDINKAKQMGKGVSADAFFAARISKGPNGVTIILSLFLTKDSKLLAKATIKDSKRFDIPDLKEQMDSLLAKIVSQIPYQGRVLSRDGKRVTINIGMKDGMQAGQVVSVIQIISVNRHPKFNFLVSTEKEIIGRAKILKVDDTLSFATILSEKEKGAIAKNAKVAGIDFVTYPDSGSLTTDGSDDATERPENQVSFGKDPSSWLPRRTPTFGQVGARLGLASYNGSMALNSAGSISGTSPISPQVFLDGELWLTPEWTIHVGFKYGIYEIKNPLSSSPPRLNQNLTSYEMLFGYNFRFGATIWGPSVELLAGYLDHKLYVDDATPTTFTTMEYTGFKAGVRGSMPVYNDRWSAGAEAFMILFPRLNETPVSSGANNSNTINQFGVFGGYKFKENLRLQGNLDFELYSTTFSGAGTRTDSATSSSQRFTTLSGGIYYLF